MDKIVLALILTLLSCSEERVHTKNIPHKTYVVDEVTIVSKKPPTRLELVTPLLNEIKEQESELLPFDEPRQEFGLQLDGQLRPTWEHAYMRGRSYYTFNGDRYATMHNGAPHVPQVCADFIVDTIDRTAETWYVPSLKRPAKTMGRYDMRMQVKAHGLDPRRVNELVEFFKQNPSRFEIVFEGIGPSTGKTESLKKWLKTHDAQVGDLIMIKGKVPWDAHEEHAHSFFVTGLDENGYVNLVTGNPIYPVERTLRIEGNRTPKRRITHIIRITDEFLGQLTGLTEPM